MLRAVFAAVLVCAALAPTGGAVKCYRCAMGDPRCGGPGMDLSEVPTENCTLAAVATGLTESVGEDRFPKIESEAGIGSFSLPEATAAAIPLGCLKLEKRNVTTGEVSTARHCIWLGHDDVDACAAISASADVTYCAICDYDLCNAAGLPAVTSLLQLPLWALALRLLSP
ncbi:uncharacterized protein LOC124596138 [Schistocerca americana]|uniref:uncharacterized protein LOC124596138 n=1 Tax=Schistocerca americana TaxID=7009 RepID=UPI001F50162F|nr:uncharacterized protein LOC124596138 [Schistocerca americana]XP_049773342.1 uncharacterized protein LOC126161487 [Schistocerca cancellata]